MRTIDSGMRGTDNCPVCGRAMEQREITITEVEFIKLSCRRGDHYVQILLRPHPEEDGPSEDQ